MLRLRTFGAVDLRDERGQPVRDLVSQPKRIALLIYLVVEGARRPVPREHLLALFWPESDEEHARNALSQALYHLRQALGPEAIIGQKGAAVEVSREALWCDLLAVDEALAQGDVERALDLHQGEFCPTLTLSGAPGFEEWASETRRDLHRRLLETARRAVDRLVGAEDLHAAARIARRVVPLVPDERDVRTYLTLIEQSGDGTGALRAYDEYAGQLRSSLETQPAAETRALADAIRSRRGSAPRVEATDAGAYATLRAVPAKPLRAARGGHLVLGLTLTVVLLAALLVIPAGVARVQRTDVARVQRAVAVFPFRVRGGESAQLLGDGMPDLLAVRLDGAPPVQAIDPRSSTAAAAGREVDPLRGEALSEGLGARYFVLGTVAQVAGDVEVDGALYEVGRRGRPLVTATARGDTAALFRVVEDVAGRLLAGLHDDRDTTLARLAAVTTSSLPALKAYLRGERALRAGLDAQAAAAFREAIQLDTAFALALYRLAVTATWVPVPGIDDPTIWATAAARHSARLTPLGRDLLDAYRAYRALDPRSEERYRAITQSHPDNVEAWFMLGEARFHYGPFSGRSPSAARAAFGRVLALDPTHSHALLHMARLAAIEGRAEELDSLAVRYASRDAAPTRTLEVRALQAWVRRDSVAAAAVAREAQEADDLLASSLSIAASNFAADLDAAQAITFRLAQPGHSPSSTRVARVRLSDFDLLAGRIGEGRPVRLPAGGDPDWRLESEALMAAEPAFGLSRLYIADVRDRLVARRNFQSFLWGVVESSPGGSALMRSHLLLLLSRRLGDAEAAARYAAARPAPGARPQAALEAALDATERADVARMAGRPREVLAELDRVPFDITPGLPIRVREGARFAYAEALVALDRDADALPWYESFIGPYDTPFLAIAQLRQAQIHERAGRRARAAECYRRSLRLWRDASAEFAPLVEQARAGLARVAVSDSPSD